MRKSAYRKLLNSKFSRNFFTFQLHQKLEKVIKSIKTLNLYDRKSFFYRKIWQKYQPKKENLAKLEGSRKLWYMLWSLLTKKGFLEETRWHGYIPTQFWDFLIHPSFLTSLVLSRSATQEVTWVQSLMC